MRSDSGIEAMILGAGEGRRAHHPPLPDLSRGRQAPLAFLQEAEMKSQRGHEMQSTSNRTAKGGRVMPQGQGSREEA